MPINGGHRPFPSPEYELLMLADLGILFSLVHVILERSLIIISSSIAENCNENITPCPTQTQALLVLYGGPSDYVFFFIFHEAK